MTAAVDQSALVALRYYFAAKAIAELCK